MAYGFAIQYLNYLKDVSRRIVRKAGFENVMPLRGRNDTSFFFPFHEDVWYSLTRSPTGYSIKDSRVFSTDYLLRLELFLNKNDERRLLIGLGLLSGKDKNNTQLNAPLCYCLAKLEKDNAGMYELSIDIDTCFLNIDLVSRFVDISYNDADDEKQLDPASEQQLIKLRELQEMYLNTPPTDTQHLERLWRELRALIPAPLSQVAVSSEPFSFDTRNKQKGLAFYPLFFLFAHTVPSELSTYESLRQMADAVAADNDLHHTGLTSLLNHLLSGSEYKNQIAPVLLPDAVKKSIAHLPIALSETQSQVLENIWSHQLMYVQGPPGTGKSHTIRALMAAAALQGKSVLLVSHKEAALQVVKSGLDTMFGNDSVLHITANGRAETRETLEHRMEVSKKNAYLRLLHREENHLLQEYTRLQQGVEALRNEIDAMLVSEHRHHGHHVAWMRRHQEVRDRLPQEEVLSERVDKPAKLLNDVVHRKAHNYVKQLYITNPVQRKQLLLHHKILHWYRQNLGVSSRMVIRTRDYRWLADFFAEWQAYVSAKEAKAKLSAERLAGTRTRLADALQELAKIKSEYLRKNFEWTYLKRLGQQPWGDNPYRKATDNYRVALGSRKTNRIKERWERIDFDKLLQMYPLWCAELRTLNEVLPLQPEMFDIVVVDEASQVNLAEILPALYRGKRWLIVGDENQLHLNATGITFSLSRSFDQLMWQHNELDTVLTLEDARRKKLLVSEASILMTLRATDLLDTTQRHLLTEHFRSLPRLAQYTNEHYYDGQLSLMQENPAQWRKPVFLAYVTGGERQGKYVPSEMAKVWDVLKVLTDTTGSSIKALPELSEALKQHGQDGLKTLTIGIISILSEQRDRMREEVSLQLSAEAIAKHEILIGTPEDFQGNERDIILLTLGVGNATRPGLAHYQNPNRMNVATSRARLLTILIYGALHESLSSWRRYQNHFTGSNAQPLNPSGWAYDESKHVSGFEERIAAILFEYKGQQAEVELYNQVNAIGQKRLDFVLHHTQTQKTVALEVDGPAHFYDGTVSYTEAHQYRTAVLQRAGWRIVHTPYHLWYDGASPVSTTSPAYIREKNRLFKALNDALLPG